MAVDEFSQLVRNYVRAIDKADELSPHALLSVCARLLPRIYADGLDLPDVETTNDTISAEVASPMGKLASLMGRHDFYHEVFDPCFEEKPVGASLADDLADIYLDLARPLAAFDAGQISDAVWTWKFNLQTHCGDHLVDAMRVIHRLINSHMSPDYTADAGKE